jgi:hypothetical protein
MSDRVGGLIESLIESMIADSLVTRANRWPETPQSQRAESQSNRHDCSGVKFTRSRIRLAAFVSAASRSGD